jgi:hypothetical protein
MTVFVNGSGDKVVGHYDEETNVFKKLVKKSKHLFLKDDAWGIDKGALEKLKPDTKILINEIEEERQYSISVEKFKEHGFTADYGYGEQVFCPRQHFFVKTLPYGQSLKV